MAHRTNFNRTVKLCRQESAASFPFRRSFGGRNSDPESHSSTDSSRGLSRACLKTRFGVGGGGFLRRDDKVDDETYRKYVESELRVAVKNPLPQSEWGFQTCSSPVSRKSHCAFLKSISFHLPKITRQQSYLGSKDKAQDLKYGFSLRD